MFLGVCRIRDPHSIAYSEMFLGACRIRDPDSIAYSNICLFRDFQDPDGKNWVVSKIPTNDHCNTIFFLQRCVLNRWPDSTQLSCQVCIPYLFFQGGFRIPFLIDFDRSQIGFGPTLIFYKSDMTFDAKTRALQRKHYTSTKQVDNGPNHDPRPTVTTDTPPRGRPDSRSKK